MSDRLRHEVSRRRTFAIISHPDAGKTTLTEKLLLYGGAIHLAGAVKSRKASRHATSDWMEIEKKRGISVTSSVMQFKANGFCINILDTPGHQDFSEDTYRTLCAADSAVMLIDGAKGVEEQTVKLFEVCRARGIPIFTFINKMDRASRDPFDLMDELEKVLGIQSVPLNWPIGTHGDFCGVYNRQKKQVELFDPQRQDHGASMVRVRASDLDDPALALKIGQAHQEQLAADIDLLDLAGDALDMDRIQAGQLTPLFFGSALTNFGVDFFLNAFLAMAPPPPARNSNEGPVHPQETAFTGFVFKIQANMNPDHRDRMAFIRICSGRFEKGMAVYNTRLKRAVRLALPQQLMAQERHTIEQAFPGDIIGVFDPGLLQISDTLTCGRPNLAFEPIPSFAPEHFARVSPEHSMQRKAFSKGKAQLAQEGAIQCYKEAGIGMETVIVGVVGLLQLDVLRERLLSEYRVAIRQTPLSYRFARWLLPGADGQFPNPDALSLTSTTRFVYDAKERPVLLFESDWAIQWALERNQKLRLAHIQDLLSF